MYNPVKKISPAIFGIILICLFLPFVTVSCQSQKLVTLTGVQLATGTKVEYPRLFEKQKRQEEIPADPGASFILVSACIGLGTSLLRSKKTAIVPAIAGAVGSGLLLMTKTKIDNEVLKQGKALLQVNYEIGFWMSFFLFILATVFNAYIFFQGKNHQQSFTNK
jgi:hypothetical protein